MGYVKTGSKNWSTDVNNGGVVTNQNGVSFRGGRKVLGNGLNKFLRNPKLHLLSCSEQAASQTTAWRGRGGRPRRQRRGGRGTSARGGTLGRSTGSQFLMDR